AYITATARWLGRLRERVAVWQLRWNQHDQRLKPELMVKERHGSRLIYDSRSGSAVEHKPSATGWTVLEALSDQHRPARLAEKLGLTETEVASEVAYLKQRGLVFEEDGVLLS